MFLASANPWVQKIGVLNNFENFLKNIIFYPQPRNFQKFCYFRGHRPRKTFNAKTRFFAHLKKFRILQKFLIFNLPGLEIC